MECGRDNLYPSTPFGQCDFPILGRSGIFHLPLTSSRDSLQFPRPHQPSPFPAQGRPNSWRVCTCLWHINPSNRLYNSASRLRSANLAVCQQLLLTRRDCDRPSGTLVAEARLVCLRVWTAGIPPFLDQDGWELSAPADVVLLPLCRSMMYLQSSVLPATLQKYDKYDVSKELSAASPKMPWLQEIRDALVSRLSVMEKESEAQGGRQERKK